jgi:hypothetical protein
LGGGLCTKHKKQFLFDVTSEAFGRIDRALVSCLCQPLPAAATRRDQDAGHPLATVSLSAAAARALIYAEPHLVPLKQLRTTGPTVPDQCPTKPSPYAHMSSHHGSRPFGSVCPAACSLQRLPCSLLMDGEWGLSSSSSLSIVKGRQKKKPQKTANVRTYFIWPGLNFCTRTTT